MRATLSSLALVLACGACDRGPPELPSAPPALPSEAPRPSQQPSQTREPEHSQHPLGHACSVLSERVARETMHLDALTRVQQSASDLAGQSTCRYQWDLPNASEIRSRNAQRAQSNPAVLAMMAHGDPGAAARAGIERDKSELGLTVLARRSGGEATVARGLSLLMEGAGVTAERVEGVGQQAYWEADRATLTMRVSTHVVKITLHTAEPDGDRGRAIELGRALTPRIGTF